MSATTAPRTGAPVRGGGSDTTYRPPYLAAGLAALGVWLLYAFTLAPSTAFWDTSEYIATAHIFSIPHPPGNPLFVVLARAWEVLLAPTGLSVAVRINLFSATMGAVAHGFWFLLVDRILAFFTPDRRFRIAGAAAAVLISATAFTVWNQSNVNEKVYTVSLCTIALLSWLAFHWRDNLGQGKDDNLILLMVFILALSVGNHLMAFLAAPALVLFILLVEPRTLLNWKLYAAALVAAVVGLSVHLFLPLRAGLDPIINEADPSTWHALLASLARKQYDKPSILMNPVTRDTGRDISLVMAQIGNYLQYFDWQWARSIAGNVSVFGGMRPVITALFIGLGAYGGWSHWRRDRISWFYVALLFSTLSLGLVIYLNFKYGYSWARNVYPDVEMHEVRERDYFFMVSFSVWGLWAGIGIAALWQRFSEDLLPRVRSIGRAYATTSPVLVLALLPLALNWSWASRANDYFARDWAYDLLMSVEPYGVLFTNGDNDTFPLWYVQEVEGVRRDVTVIVTSYLNTPWYVKQLRELTKPCPPGVDPLADPTRIVCQRPYQPDKSGGFYERLAERQAPTTAREPIPQVPPRSLLTPPTRSIIPLSDTEIDRIAGTYPFRTDQTLSFTAGKVETTLSEGTVMLPADVFMTAILTEIMKAPADRPIYYASTTQTYRDLNLDDFLIRQGFAYQLHDGPVEADSTRGIYQLPTNSPFRTVVGRYFDLPRTDSLLWDVFVHRPGIPEKWPHWVDAATQNIPYYYSWTHYAAAQVHYMLGEEQKAQRHLERAEAWSKLAEK